MRWLLESARENIKDHKHKNERGYPILDMHGHDGKISGKPTDKHDSDSGRIGYPRDRSELYKLGAKPRKF
jgi:hypothetical protein